MIAAIESFKTLADHLPIMVWVADSDGAVEYYNSTWYEYTGQTFEIAKGWGWKSVHHPEDLPKVLNEWPEAIALGMPYEAEFRLRSHKTGQFRWFLTRGSPFRDKSGKIIKWLGTTTDIDDLRIGQYLLEKTQAELMEAKNVAEAANSTKSEFIANMSHEIRTPLAAIIGYSEFLLESEKVQNQERKFVEGIARNSKHLSNLVNEILDLSKVESGHLEIEYLTFNLGEILEYVEAVLGFKANEKGVQLKVTVDKKVPKNIRTDPTRFRQILLNIIGNAVKFTSKGTVEVHVECPECDDKLQSSIPRKLLITVKDSGLGISESKQNLLFRRFMQSDTSISRKFGGTGLGLALSKKLAIALGGNISLVQSTLGKGSTFLITLDIGQVSEFSQVDLIDSITNRTEIRIDANNKPFKNINILVVDDSPDNLALIDLMLKQTGAILSTACNGTEGVEKALTSKYDLVLMDIQMPGIDGYEATKKLRREGFRKPIIALTANAMKEDREIAFRAGFDDHLTKPINKMALIKSIAHFAGKINKTSKNEVGVPR